jgi:hypothetical protein
MLHYSSIVTVTMTMHLNRYIFSHFRLPSTHAFAELYYTPVHWTHGPLTRRTRDAI